MGDIFVMGNNRGINHRQPIQPLKGFIHTRNFRFACIAWSAVGVFLASTAFCEFDSSDSYALHSIYSYLTGSSVGSSGQNFNHGTDFDRTLNLLLSSRGASIINRGTSSDPNFMLTDHGALVGWAEFGSSFTPAGMPQSNLIYDDGILGRVGEMSFITRDIGNVVTNYLMDGVSNIVDALYIDEDGFGELGKPIVEYVKGVHEDLVSTKGKNAQEETVGDMLYDIRRTDSLFYTNFFGLFLNPLLNSQTNLSTMFGSLDTGKPNMQQYGMQKLYNQLMLDGLPIVNAGAYNNIFTDYNFKPYINSYTNFYKWQSVIGISNYQPVLTSYMPGLASLSTSQQQRLYALNAMKFKAYNTLDLTEPLIELGDTTNHVTSIPNYGVSTNDLDELDLIDIPDTANVNYKTQLERIADGDEETDTGEDILDSFEDITFAIEDLGESIKEFKDGDSTYGLTYRVQLPAWEGEGDEMYLDFSLPQNAKDKINSYWRIVEYLVKMSVFAWAVLQMWSFLADKPNNLDEPIIFN